MNLIHAKDYDQLSRIAAGLIAAQVNRKPNSLLGFATGSTPLGTYKQLVSMCNAGDVDFSIGREAFIEEWSARINDYLFGSPLSGYGETFAEAAWEAGIDPRWSPAISNTESTKGRVCFKSHNAWGWDQTNWPDWDTAIRSHVAGLARGYGFTISYSYAMRYCPPNYDNWYRDTLNQMQLI